MPFYRIVMIAVALAHLALPDAVRGQQSADENFDASVDRPAFRDGGPRVLFDEAHHNFHRADGRYKPFVRLMCNDGFQFGINRSPFSADLLDGADVLVIVNALGGEGLNNANAARPAFSEAECDAVLAWVEAGGSLLLITDHYPTGSAAAALARRFEIQMSEGQTKDEPTFSRENKLLGEHELLDGRRSEERVNSIRTFTGQTLKGPFGATELLRMPEGAREFTPKPTASGGTEPVEGPAWGHCQCVVLERGKGRVVVLGEAAMLTAQVAGDGQKFGMNVAGIDNRQFALNVMRWLGRGGKS